MLNDSLLDITQKLAKVGGWSVTYTEPRSVFFTPTFHAIFEHELPVDPTMEQVASYILPRYRQNVLKSLDQCRLLATACDEEFEITTSNGSNKWLHLIAQSESVTLDDSSVAAVRVIGALQDITLQKQEEIANRVLSERLLNTLENMSDAFFLLDKEWRVIYVNKAAAKLAGRPLTTSVGEIFWEKLPYLMDTQLYPGFLRAVRDNIPFHTEYFSKALNNWIELDAFPSPEGLAVYFHSVTERKLMQERLDQAQHMESIGKLTGNVAHDFNNLLTIILTNAELLHTALAGDPSGRRLAADIRSAVHKGHDLTRRLLAYARKQRLAPRVVDINSLVDGMRELLVRTLGVNISIALQLQVPLPPALVDEHQLEGALLNLALNSRDALPRGGELTIRTSAFMIDEAEASRHPEFKVGHYVHLRVSDNGIGIKSEHLPHVFEPFFTTKEGGKGTGLGLSSVFGFAKQSDGHVTITSQIGAGTSVDLYLPVAGAKQQIPPEKTEPLRGGSETILLVDDDEMVTTAAQTLLAQRLGYQVLAVSSGETALSVLKSNTTIDLLFSDVMMPGMNGHELARQAQRLQPKLRVLLTSGFVSPSLVKSPADAGFPLLPKPYTQEQLARMLRDILDRPA